MNTESKQSNVKGLILIVDDNLTNLDVLFDYLDTSGFEVYIAEDGESAIERTQYVHPDIILLDVMMPGIDGFETCRRIKSNPKTKDIPVIFMTALSDTEHKVRGFEVGAVDYVTKPFQHEEVLARVTTHLMLRNLQKELRVQNTQLQQENVWRKQIEDKLQLANVELQQHNRRLQAELNLAREIQLKLLPSPRPNWGGLKIACYTVPAYQVGGDFYAYYPQSISPIRDAPKIQNRFALGVGDISGKGMPAALMMTISLAFFQESIRERFAPSQALNNLNKILMPYTQTTGQNCALIYAEITPSKTKDNPYTLRVANAGCVTPLIRHQNDTVEWIDTFGLPLGVEDSESFGYVDIIYSLKPGDLLIFTSDGVVEAQNDEQELFGFERLEAAVKSGPKNSPDAMLDHLKTVLGNFVGDTEPHDDLTILLIQV